MIFALVRSSQIGGEKSSMGINEKEREKNNVKLKPLVEFWGVGGTKSWECKWMDKGKIEMSALYGRYSETRYPLKEKQIFRQLLNIIGSTKCCSYYQSKKHTCLPTHNILGLRNISSDERTIDLSYFPHDTRIGKSNYTVNPFWAGSVNHQVFSNLCLATQMIALQEK